MQDKPPGIAIAEITHGQMPVIARHSGAILAIANHHPGRSEEFQRVLNYAKLQRTWCLWGAVPGSITDEASPFNACSHAYLAATRDLLLRMKDDPRNLDAAELSRRIDIEMLVASTALELCGFSLSPFDTANIVRPVWSQIAQHRPSLLAFAALAGVTLLVSALAGRWLWRG